MFEATMFLVKQKGQAKKAIELDKYNNHSPGSKT